MHTISLGFVKTVTAGTPIPLATPFAALGLAAELTNNGKVHEIQAWPLLANSGITFFGHSTTSRQSSIVMNKSTGVGVLKQVQIPATTGQQDHVSIQACDESNSLLVSDYAIDSNVNAEGFAIFLVVV